MSKLPIIFLPLSSMEGLNPSLGHSTLNFTKDFPIHFLIEGSQPSRQGRYYCPHFVGKTFSESHIWPVEPRPPDLSKASLPPLHSLLRRVRALPSITESPFSSLGHEEMTQRLSQPGSRSDIDSIDGH